MKRLEKLTRKNLGEVLLDEGLLTRGQLADAELERKRSGDSLGSILVESKAISEWELAKVMVGQYQLPFVMLSALGSNKKVKDIVTEDLMVRGKFVPIAAFGKVLTLAVAELPGLDVLEDVQEQTGCIPYLYITVKSEIDQILQTGAAYAPAEDDSSDIVPSVNLSTEEVRVLDEVFGGGEDGPMEADEGTVLELDESDNSTSWHNIFDAANSAIMKEMGKD